MPLYIWSTGILLVSLCSCQKVFSYVIIMANSNRHFVLSLYIFWYFLVSLTLANGYMMVSLYIGQKVFSSVP
jgi:hypothetical protein